MICEMSCAKFQGNPFRIEGENNEKHCIINFRGYIYTDLFLHKALKFFLVFIDFFGIIWVQVLRGLLPFGRSDTWWMTFYY